MSKLSPRLPGRSSSCSRKTSFNAKIVVVAAGKKKEQDDRLYKALEDIPTIQPFIQPNTGISFRTSVDSNLCRLDPRVLIRLCERHKEHMRICNVECISHQDAINHKIKEVVLYWSYDFILIYFS